MIPRLLFFFGKVCGDGRVDGLAAEAALQDGAVRGEQNEVRDGVDAVERCGNPLAVQYLRPGQIQLFQGLFRVGALVEDRDADHVKLFAVKSLPDLSDMGHVRLAGTAPGGPVVQQDIFDARPLDAQAQIYRVFVIRAFFFTIFVTG